MDFDKLNQLPEYRAMPFLDFEARDDGWAFEGLASPYGETADLGSFTEEFKHGAYRKAIASGDNTRLVYDHSPPHVPVLATTKGETFQIKDDVKGLHVRGSMAKHYLGEATRELINRGDIKGMSPGFVVGAGNSHIQGRAGKPHRVITNLNRLIEISLTPDPAYTGTTAEMRSLWAIQMASSLNDMQHAFMGGYAQPESRAVVEEPRTEPDETEPAPVEETRAESQQCDKCRATLEEGTEHECAPLEEQRSGAEPVDETAYAARTRRLQMLGLTLPKH